MELLDDEAQVEARFDPFADSAHLDGRYVHSLRQTYHWLRIILDAPGGTPR
jgi:hypothetical protein